MKIIQITVSAGRVLPHPTEQFSNLRPSLSYTAIVEADDDPMEKTRELQALAERAIEEHKAALMVNIREIQERAELETEIAHWEKQAEKAEVELEHLREKRSISDEPLEIPAPAPTLKDEDYPF